MIYNASFLIFFFFYCLIKLPHNPRILLCLIFFIFLLRPNYAALGKILFLGKLFNASPAAGRLQLPPRVVLFCSLMCCSCRKRRPAGNHAVETGGMLYMSPFGLALHCLRNKPPFNHLHKLLLQLRRIPRPCDHHVCCSPPGHFSNQQ